MPWDRGYYYRAQRIGGKPTRVYVGGGLLGAAAALEDARRAALETARRRERAAERAALGEIDEEYRRLRTYTAALLTAAGWYQHKREWRKMSLKVLASVATGQADGGRLQDDVAAAVDALVRRCNAPKPSRADLDALRQLLAIDGPNGAVLTVLSGSATLNRIIEAYEAGEGTQRIMRADADRLLAVLGWASAPPFERPLLEHVAACWVRLQLVERDHAAATAGAHNRDSGLYWDRRLSEAQRRYLRALGLLAKLRHLGPAVQVNVANQQVVVNGRGERE